MANISMTPDANESKLAAERIEQIARLESEIEAKTDEINRLRINDPSAGRAAEDVEENRDESDQPAAHRSESALRDESFGEIIVLWERPVADENRGGLKKIAIGRDKRVPADGTPRRSTDVKIPPDMVYTKSYESDETSVASAGDTSNPPSPRSPAGLFEHLFRPFGSPENKLDASSPPSPRQTGGLVEHLLLPLGLGSPGIESESLTESEVLKGLIEQRDRQIESLQETISSDTQVMRKMKETIERLSVELLSARQSEEMFRALGSRSSSLEDEVEELRVENTKLRIGCQALEEEKRRIEKEMRTELELLHLETGRHARYFE